MLTKAAPLKPIKLRSLIAKAGIAPLPWQSAAPLSLYGTSLPPVSNSSEFQRVATLPVRDPYVTGTPYAEALIHMAKERFARDVPSCDCASRKRDCITMPHLVQAWTLYELEMQRGVLGAIGVGHGKTFLDIMAPMVFPHIQTAVLLIPPGVVKQLIFEYELLRNHWRVPGLISHAAEQYVHRIAGPTLHILPYSKLSRPDATTWLTHMAPQLIIADECHHLRRADTARTSRFTRYLEKAPNTIVAAWSGTLTTRELEDCAHLSAACLKQQSPLPLLRQVLQEWSSAVSSNKADAAPRHPGALLEFCEPGEHVREGVRRRLSSTPGFISTTEASVDTPMTLVERKPKQIPESISVLLKDVRETWQRPDGEEFEDALSVMRCLRELACGFYYRWTFPHGEPVHLILDWLKYRREWNRAVRSCLFSRVEHLDSPDLCKRAAKRAWGDLPSQKDLPSWKTHAWPAWRYIMNKVHPVPVAVRVHDYLVRDAQTWLSDGLGVVWYTFNEFGEWLSEVSELPKYGGGAKTLIELLKEQGHRSIIASVKSHGTGRDGLQRIFHRQLIAQPPDDWEQLLGRLHRVGQTKPVETFFYAHTPEMRAHIRQNIIRATYVTQLTPNSQKIRAFGLSIEEGNEIVAPIREGTVVEAITP